MNLSCKISPVTWDALLTQRISLNPRYQLIPRNTTYPFGPSVKDRTLPIPLDPISLSEPTYLAGSYLSHFPENPTCSSRLNLFGGTPIIPSITTNFTKTPDFQRTSTISRDLNDLGSILCHGTPLTSQGLLFPTEPY